MVVESTSTNSPFYKTMKTLQHILYWLIVSTSRMPYFLLYLIADFVYVMMYYVFGYRKQVVFGNLRRSFPEKSEAEITKIAKQFYHNLADIQLEAIKSVTVTKEEILKRVVLRNPEAMENYTANGDSTILATIHKCNWEWALLGYSAGFSITNIDAMYKPLSSKFVDELMIKVRSKFGATMVADASILRRIASSKDKVRTTIMASDQTPAKEAPHKLMFLNQPTLFFAGIEKIAVLMNVPIIFTDVNRVKRGYYEITFYPMSVPPYDKKHPGIVEAYAEMTEQAILRQPQNWLWSHKRWKHEVEM